MNHFAGASLSLLKSIKLSVSHISSPPPAEITASMEGSR